MKIIIVACFLVVANIAFCQNHEAVSFLTKDSLPFKFIREWKFSTNDDSLAKNTIFDDSKWLLTKSKLDDKDSNSKLFKGFGWFRYHFKIDSNLCQVPLAITMEHVGASEIYIDGQLIISYGEIKGKDSTIYYDPLEVPEMITLKNLEEHVIAVKFANYNKKENDLTGFKITLETTNELIENRDFNNIAITFLPVSLGFIFLTISLIHLLFYLYYPVIKSNLYFSLFMCCIASLFLVFLMNNFSHDISFSDSLGQARFFITCIACISFAIFIYHLLKKKSTIWLWLIVLNCLVVIVFKYYFKLLFPYSLVTLLLAVSAYGVISIIVAIIKKVKGIWIIGTGILFFILFFTALIIAASVTDNLQINNSSIIGYVLIIGSGLAIISIPLSMSIYQAWGFAVLNKDLSMQLNQVKQLSEKTIQQELEKKKILENQNEELEIKVEKRTALLNAEKKKSDELLLNILPEEIAEELKKNGEAVAKQYNHVTVLFTDFVNFTGISEQLSPNELVAEIHKNFTAFDGIMEQFGLEKIKTIGDAYLAVCGLPNEVNDHAQRVIKAALAIQDFMAKNNGKFQIRIGVHTGSVVAGIVGVKKYAYDIWGDTVNTASRMESNSEAGKINISQATYELVKNDFTCEYRGKINAKNKGEVDMYFVK